MKKIRVKIKRALERLSWGMDSTRDRIASGWDSFKWALMCAIWPSVYTNLYARYRSLINICNARDEEYQEDFDRWAEEKEKLKQEITELRKLESKEKNG